MDWRGDVGRGGEGRRGLAADVEGEKKQMWKGKKKYPCCIRENVSQGYRNKTI